MKNRKGRVRKSLIIGAAVAACLVSLIAIWWQDVAPIEDDYTLADLRSAPPEFAETYDLLMSLANQHPDVNGAPAIGLAQADVNVLETIISGLRDTNDPDIREYILERADDIDLLWTKAKKGRVIIEQLADIDQIADLTEPNLFPDAMPSLTNIGYMIQLYRLQVLSLFEKGDKEQSLHLLGQIGSIFRKFSETCRPLVSKLVCYAALMIHIQTVNYFANNPQAPDGFLDELHRHFEPITDKQASLRNSLIFEYLLFRDALPNYPEMKKVTKTPFCKRNSTLRLYRNFLIGKINQTERVKESKKSDIRVCPRVIPRSGSVQIDTDVQIPFIYHVYNPVGSMYVKILAPALESVIQLKTRIQIHDDLVQIVLNKRLGQPVDLKARAYSDKYVIDLNKKIIFSPGPDKVAYTEDDIKLQINPDVLNLNSSVQER